MKKRLLSGLLWFYVTWFAWAFVAAFSGITELAGPVLGAVVAMVIAGDPMGRIWPEEPAHRQSTVRLSEPA